MKSVRIGVPPGVGDVYWVLTKLQAFRRKKGIEHVTLCIKSSQYDRAGDWSQLVDFVERTEYVDFKPPHIVLQQGYTARRHGDLDYIMWPNAVIDQGKRIERWLPDLECDLDFPLRIDHIPKGPPRTLLYPSSTAINESWMRHRIGRTPAQYWQQVAEAIGGTVSVIGAKWDEDQAQQIKGQYESLVGETSLAQLCALIRDASVVCGVICGITILANHLRTPCVAIWPSHRFPPTFPYAWVPSDAKYIALPATSARDPREIARLVHAVARCAPWQERSQSC